MIPECLKNTMGPACFLKCIGGLVITPKEGKDKCVFRAVKDRKETEKV
jgi:hypothetical protein